jgi:signal peptidase I
MYQDAPPKPKRRGSRLLRELVETILLTLLIFFGVRLAVQNFRVDGISMETTVHNSDLVLVNKVSYMLSSPSRGDIVVFKPPPLIGQGQDFIKRVIAVPGDTVQIRANLGVWLNGKKLNEPYLNSSACPNPPPLKPWLCEIPNYNWGPATVPSGKYFVLGDDRNDSYDSHAWCGENLVRPCTVIENGVLVKSTWVPRSTIVGKALVSFWPIFDFRFFGF